MECNEFQKNIQPFIYGQLNMLKKEEMLEPSDNYHGEYAKFIEKTKRDIRKYKNNMLKRRIAFPGVVGAAVLFTGITVKTETDVKIAEVKESKTLIDNDLSMRFRFSDSKVLPDTFMDIEEIAKEIEIRRRLYEK